PSLRGTKMLVGVISDTHVPNAAPSLPAKVLALFHGVGLILHAGDLVVLDVLEELQRIAPVTAVRGNMDSREVVAALPERTVVEVGGFRIGVTHGSGTPVGLAERVWSEFRNEGVNAIVFGHSHAACREERDGVLLLNPGSPTDRRFTKSNSVGLLGVTDRLTFKIIPV
ncbi:MAG: metallophosphoesterase family protein, partial [candidate division WOR-3 bacterium]